jgi:hypothetical protein
MRKFGLNWRMEIQDINGDIQKFGFPLTVDLQISRNTMAGAQDAEFVVYNLGDGTRNLIRKNAIAMNDYRSVKFYAGYGLNMTLVFQGQVLDCQSERDVVDWMTSISCKDPGLIQTNDVSASFASGSLCAQNLQAVLNSFMPSASLGAIGGIFEQQPTLLKGNSYSGSVLGVLSQMTGGNFSGGNLFFENQRLFVLQDFEAVPDGGFTVLDSSAGLLGSPYYENTYVHAQLEFEPRLIMAQLVDLESETQTWLNGTKKVVAYSHEGTISGAVASQVTSEISLYAPQDSRGFQIIGVGAIF